MKSRVYENCGTRDRRGGFVIEGLVAMILLGVLFSAILPPLTWVKRERGASADRQLAQQTVANVMEQISLLKWEDMTAERLEQIELPEHVAEQLRKAVLRIESTAIKTPAARRIDVSLAWEGVQQRQVLPVRLSRFFHQPLEQEDTDAKP